MLRIPKWYTPEIQPYFAGHAGNNAAHNVHFVVKFAANGGNGAALIVGFPLFSPAAICRREQWQGESLVRFYKLLILCRI